MFLNFKSWKQDACFLHNYLSESIVDLETRILMVYAPLPLSAWIFARASPNVSPFLGLPYRYYVIESYFIFISFLFFIFIPPADM